MCDSPIPQGFSVLHGRSGRSGLRNLIPGWLQGCPHGQGWVPKAAPGCLCPHGWGFGKIWSCGPEHPQFSPLSVVTWAEILSSSRSLLFPRAHVVPPWGFLQPLPQHLPGSNSGKVNLLLPLTEMGLAMGTARPSPPRGELLTLLYLLISD